MKAVENSRIGTGSRASHKVDQLAGTGSPGRATMVCPPKVVTDALHFSRHRPAQLPARRGRSGTSALASLLV